MLFRSTVSVLLLLLAVVEIEATGVIIAGIGVCWLLLWICAGFLVTAMVDVGLEGILFDGLG